MLEAWTFHFVIQHDGSKQRATPQLSPQSQLLTGALESFDAFPALTSSSLFTSYIALEWNLANSILFPAPKQITKLWMPDSSSFLKKSTVHSKDRSL